MKELIKRSNLSIKRLKMSKYIKKVNKFWLFRSFLTESHLFSISFWSLSIDFELFDQKCWFKSKFPPRSIQSPKITKNLVLKLLKNNLTSWFFIPTSFWTRVLVTVFLREQDLVSIACIWSCTCTILKTKYLKKSWKRVGPFINDVKF